MTIAMDEVPLLAIDALRVSFRSPAGEWVPALKGVDLIVPTGRTVALVGESGSGKSLTALAVMGLLPAGNCRIEAGSRIHFRSEDLLAKSAAEHRALRGRDLAMVFQDPFSSLNPVFRIGDQIAELLRFRRGLTRYAANAEVDRLLSEVELADAARIRHAYPHELSGGQQQRAMIAMALAGDPALLIADEATTALDVTVQRQILTLLARLQRERHMALLYITHDLDVVADLAQHVVVMQGGEVREQGPVDAILQAPQSPYTQTLLAARLSVWSPAAPSRSPEAALGSPLLAVDAVAQHFRVRSGRFGTRRFDALQPVSFRLERGRTLGIVGESGSGKTTLARALIGLPPPAEGRLHFAGQELDPRDPKAWVPLRRRIQMVFQNPYASLNPRFTVAEILAEPMCIHGLHAGPGECRARCAELLARVGLETDALPRYPHQFSGGQRQRIAIARSLALDPELLILDEPVSALDVSVQAQVLELLGELQRSRGMAYLLISHDLAVMRHMADRILVMHAGAVVEELGAEALFGQQDHHPCTARLLAAMPGRPERR